MFNFDFNFAFSFCFVRAVLSDCCACIKFYLLFRLAFLCAIDITNECSTMSPVFFLFFNFVFDFQEDTVVGSARIDIFWKNQNIVLSLKKNFPSVEITTNEMSVSESSSER